MFDNKSYLSSYYRRNKKELLEKQRKHYRQNRQEILAKRKKYRDNMSEEKKQLQSTYLKKWNAENKDRTKEYNHKPETRYKNYYKQAAGRRGYEFNITLDEFKEITSKPCYLCGDSAGGIDRFDNTVGYVLENCRPCCATCNKMKWKLEYNVFMEKIEKIYSKKFVKVLIAA